MEAYLTQPSKQNLRYHPPSKLTPQRTEVLIRSRADDIPPREAENRPSLFLDKASRVALGVMGLFGRGLARIVRPLDVCGAPNRRPRMCICVVSQLVLWLGGMAERLG